MGGSAECSGSLPQASPRDAVPVGLFPVFTLGPPSPSFKNENTSEHRCVGRMVGGLGSILRFGASGSWEDMGGGSSGTPGCGRRPGEALDVGTGH